ncbi:DUF2057 family protein [Vibrio sp. YMD68]|uniref:DUF2057 family protein n=1 Tax=Vibrio sp. YMD68 TaxID=3042300 RepID=UPI00249C7C99|nr:DUF2057 family protein [Vibrio sp. YMD68]WGV98496.1 DUF2057 family protein [Vibrio sp. YMD68]
MNVLKTLSCTCALIISHSALADITIQIPDNIELFIANGEKPELVGGFFSANKTLTLPNGENQIAFRYSSLFDRSNDRTTVESDTIIAKFEAQDQELTFSLPQYRNEREAQTKIKQLEWSLINQSDEAIEVHEDKLMKEGMQLGRDYQREVADYNRSNGIAAITATSYAAANATTALLADPASKQTSDRNGTAESTAEEMLHFWYDKADAETKARFKAHINQ